MAKLTANSVLDAALDAIDNSQSPTGRTSLVMHVCSGTPTDRASVLTNTLANVALTANTADFGAPADAGGGGRQITVAAQSGVTVTSAGDATHVAIVDGTELVVQTTVTGSPVAIAGTVDIGSFVISIGDPT